MKKTYLTLIMIIILSSLLAACVNDAAPVQPQKTVIVNTAGVTAKPTPSPTILPDTSLPQKSEPAPSPAKWPESYSSILEEYKTFADLIYHDDDYSFFDFIADNEDSFEWLTLNMPDIDSFIATELLIDGSRYRGKDDLGYALEDLNGDGSDELIILSKNYWVFAVYSTVNGKPKLLDFYWDRYRCHAIDKSNLLYIYCFYDSSEDWYYAIQRLSDDGSELLTIEQYGMESFDYDTNERYQESHYYKVTDGKSYSEREIITEAEFDELYDAWEKTTENADNSGITFIPILD